MNSKPGQARKLGMDRPISRRDFVGGVAVVITGSKAGIQAKHAGRLRLQLAALDTAQFVEDMDIPGYRLHPLKGRAKNRWSIWVSENWRLTFEFRDGNASVLDYEDYH